MRIYAEYFNNILGRFRLDFWISEWISGFQIGFLDFRVDFWISEWISGFQLGFEIGFLPTVYEISFVADPTVRVYLISLFITATAIKIMLQFGESGAAILEVDKLHHSG